MAQPYTLQFGSWSPDLQNVAVQMPFQYTATVVPSADVLNVYYQDGAFRCLPSPQSFGPAVSSRVLNALTWYDNTNAQEIVFAATTNAIYALIDSAWNAVTIEQSASVQGSGVVLQLILAGQTKGVGINISTTIGSGSIGGQILNATLVIGSGGGGVFGYVAGQYGSLTPSVDIDANAIYEIIFQQIHATYVSIAITSAASLGQSYFSTVINGGNQLFTNAANCNYSYTPGVGAQEGFSIWTWNPQIFTFSNGTVILE